MSPSQSVIEIQTDIESVRLVVAFDFRSRDLDRLKQFVLFLRCRFEMVKPLRSQ